MPKRARLHRGWTLSFVSRVVGVLVLFTLAGACNSATGPSPVPPPQQPPTQQPPAATPQVVLAGMHTLTISASSRCRSEMREIFPTRTYPATISHEDGSLVVTVHYPDMRGWVDKFTVVPGEASDVTFRMQLSDWWPIEYEAHGRMTGRMTGATVEEGLSGILDGFIETFVLNEDGTFALDADGRPRWVRCTASDHVVLFSR
jgi:hypothetical protein